MTNATQPEREDTEGQYGNEALGRALGYTLGLLVDKITGTNDAVDELGAALSERVADDMIFHDDTRLAAKDIIEGLRFFIGAPIGTRL
jgi:hypothetical protein